MAGSSSVRNSLFRGAMASELNGAENEATMRAEEAVSPIDQTLDDVDARLTSLSDQMNLCTAVLSDLKELGDVLVKRSIQDVTLPMQK